MSISTLNIDVQGIDAVVQKAQAIAGDLPDRVRWALRDGAAIILHDARATAPRRTGRLAASGHLEDTGTDTAVVFNGANPRDGYVYAGRQERRRHFALNAAKSRAPEVRRIVADAVREVIQ